MGQVRTVQVHRLLANDSVDERIHEVQENKALLFAENARRSDAKEADAAPSTHPVTGLQNWTTLPCHSSAGSSSLRNMA